VARGPALVALPVGQDLTCSERSVEIRSRRSSL
jgi:hypothetical protein